MEHWLSQLANEVLSKVAANALTSLYHGVVGWIWTATEQKPSSEVQDFLEKLGNVSEKAIRSLVDSAAVGKRVTPDQIEELVHLLLNLTHNARFHTTNGTKLSTVVRCESLIQKLLVNIQPKRAKGEQLTLGNDWKLEAFLGMGGFGEVWLAANPHYPKPWAVKFFTDEEGKRWLRDEGRALFQIRDKLENHPNIVDYLDIQTQATPYPYLALEYADAGSLEDWILQIPGERLKIDLDELVRGILDGLSEAHRVGIFHRDIKPANILLHRDGENEPQPMIADFGLSRKVVDAPMASASSAESQRIVVGTQMYLPPEAASYSRVDPAKQDVFAFGVTWYQLLVKRLEPPPYDFASRLRSDGVPERSIQIISRCLAHPDRRYVTARQLLADFLDERPDVDWDIPEGCFDVGPLTVAYLGSLTVGN